MDEFTVKKIETGFLVEGPWDYEYRHRKLWAFVDWSAALGWIKVNEPFFSKDEEAPKAVIAK